MCFQLYRGSVSITLVLFVGQLYLQVLETGGITHLTRKGGQEVRRQKTVARERFARPWLSWGFAGKVRQGEQSTV